jgi:signal transduction histidine kinase
LCITIRDNGRGLNIGSLINRKAGRGYGLLSCENTLESLGGRLEIRAPLEGGTEVTMKIPLHDGAVE